MYYNKWPTEMKVKVKCSCSPGLARHCMADRRMKVKKINAAVRGLARLTIIRYLLDLLESVSVSRKYMMMVAAFL
jgi:hypothetical protein